MLPISGKVIAASISREMSKNTCSNNWKLCKTSQNLHLRPLMNAQIESACENNGGIDLRFDFAAVYPHRQQLLTTTISNALPLSITKLETLDYWSYIIIKTNKLYVDKINPTNDCIFHGPTIQENGLVNNYWNVLETWIKLTDGLCTDFSKQFNVFTGFGEQKGLDQPLSNLDLNQKFDHHFAPIVSTKLSHLELSNQQHPVHLSACTGMPVQLSEQLNESNFTNQHRHIGKKISHTDSQEPGENAIEKLICNLIILGKPDILSILQ